MNVKALRAFCLIVTRGSLAAAAEQMHLSQPAVSHLIANLEYEMKLKLFSRDKRTLVPSPEGRSFYREASRALAGIDQLSQAAAEIGTGLTGRLRVVVMARLAAITTPAFAAFARQHPHIQLSAELHNRRDMERWMASLQFDMGFGPLPVAMAGLVVEPLMSSRMLVALPQSSRLVRRPSLSLADLAAEKLIAFVPGTLLRHQVDAIFLQARRMPDILMEVSPALACQIVASGVGYTFCDAFIAEGIQGLALVPLSPRFDLDYGVLRPAGTDLTAPMRALIDLVRTLGEVVLARAAAMDDRASRSRSGRARKLSQKAR